MMKKLSYEELFYLFEVGKFVDETIFYFDDDPNENFYVIGCNNLTFSGDIYDKPYWVGVCDFLNGCEFATAEELFAAKIFDGKSIKENWQHVVIHELGGLCVEDFMRFYGEKILFDTLLTKK